MTDNKPNKDGQEIKSLICTLGNFAYVASVFYVLYELSRLRALQINQEDRIAFETSAEFVGAASRAADAAPPNSSAGCKILADYGRTIAQRPDPAARRPAAAAASPCASPQPARR